MKELKVCHYEIVGKKNIFVNHDDAVAFCINNNISPNEIFTISKPCKVPNIIVALRILLRLLKVIYYPIAIVACLIVVCLCPILYIIKGNIEGTEEFLDKILLID